MTHPPVRATFDSPYDQYRGRIGQSFEVVAYITNDPAISEEVGPMYRIRFDDGTEVEAWPEEVEAGVDIYGQSR